jgi:predicted nucleic acid-binding Zn ribbon protein
MDVTVPDLYCPACGEKVPAGSGFCRGCGHDIAARADAVRAEPTPAELGPAASSCAACGAALPPGAQFCGSCGRAVSDDDVPAGPPTLVPSLDAEPPGGPAPAPSPEPRFDRRVAAIATAVVLVIAGGVAGVLALTGGTGSHATRPPGRTSAERPASAPATVSEAAPAAGVTPVTTDAAATDTTESTPASTDTTATSATPPAGTTGLSAQAQTLDGLMRLSEQGRAAAVRGDTDVAIASRITLLDDLRALRARATDSRLKAGLTRLSAAIRESLRQNRTCATRCTTADLRRVGRLKQEAVSTLNPILRKYTSHEYQANRI